MKISSIKIIISIFFLIAICSNISAALTFERINDKEDYSQGLLIDGFRDLTIFEPINVSTNDGQCTNPEYPYHLSINETRGISDKDLYFGFVGYNTFNNNKLEILNAIYNDTRANGSNIIEWANFSGNQSLITSTKFNLLKNIPEQHIFCLSKNYSNQKVNIFSWQYKEGNKIDLGKSTTNSQDKVAIANEDFITNDYYNEINYEFGYVIGIQIPALPQTSQNQVEDGNLLVNSSEGDSETDLPEIVIDVPDPVITDTLGNITPVTIEQVQPTLNTNVGQIYTTGSSSIVTSNGNFYCATPEKTVDYRQNRMEFSANTAIYNNQLNVNAGRIQEAKKIKTVDINITIPADLLDSTNNFKDNGVDARACFTANLNSKLQGTELEPILNSRNSRQVLDNVFSQTKGYISVNKVFYVLSINTSGILEVCVSRPLSEITNEEMILSNESIKKSYSSNTERKTYVIDDPDSFLESVTYFFGLKKKKQLEINFNVSAGLTQLNCVPPANSNGGVLDYITSVNVNSTETGKGCRVKVELNNSFLPQENMNALAVEEFFPHILVTEATQNKAENFKTMEQLVDDQRDGARNIFRLYGENQKKSFVYKAPAYNTTYDFTVPESVCNNETNTMDAVVFLPMKSSKFLRALGDFWSWLLYVGSFTIYDSRNENYFDNKYNNVYSSLGALDLSRDSQRIAETNNLYNLDYLYNISVTKVEDTAISGTLPQISTNIPDKNFLCAEKEITLKKRLRDLDFNERNTKFVSNPEAINLTTDNTQINIFVNSDFLSEVEDFKENENDARVCFETAIPQSILTELQTNNVLENKDSVLANGNVISVIKINDSKLSVCFIRPLNKLEDYESIINDVKYKNNNLTIEEIYDKENGRQKNGSAIFSLKTALTPLSCVPRSTMSYVDFNVEETTVNVTETGKSCYVDIKLKDDFWTPERISELENEDFYPHILITKSDNLKEKNYRNLNNLINERKRNAGNIFQLYGYNVNPETNFVYKADKFKTEYNFIVPDTVCDNTVNSVDMIIYAPIHSSKFFEIIERVMGWMVYIFTFTLVDIRDRSLLDYQYDNVYSSTDKLDIGSDSSQIIAKLNEGYSFYNLGVLNNKTVTKTDPSTITQNLPTASTIVDESKFNCVREPKTIQQRLDLGFNNRTANFIYDSDSLKLTILKSMIYVDINSDYLSKTTNFRENGTDARVCFVKTINIENYDFKNNYTSNFVNAQIISQIKIIKGNQDINIQVCISRPVTELTDNERMINDIKYKSDIRYTNNSRVNGNNLNIESIFDLERNNVDTNSYIFSLKAVLAPLDCTSEEEETGNKQTFDCVIPEKSFSFRKRLPFNEETSRYYFHKAKDAIKLSEEIVALEDDMLVYDINIDSEYINKVGNFKENGTDARVCFVKTLDGDVIDNLNISGTYIDTQEDILDNGIILIKLKTIRDNSNKLEICLSRPTRRLMEQESKIRNLYSSKEYTLNAVKKFLGIDFLRKDEELRKVVFRINTEVPSLGCNSNGVESELQTKVAFDCLISEPTLAERKEMDYNSGNTKFYYATGAMTFNQNTNPQEMNVQINLNKEYLANIYNFKENGKDARVCFVENIANISTNHFISSLYYIKDQTIMTTRGDVIFKLESLEDTREVRFCISRPVRRLTEIESKITNLRFSQPYDYMLKEEFLSIDWLNKDRRLKNINFSVADFNLAELDCIDPNDNQNVPLDVKYISTPSIEGFCYDPMGFNSNSGYTGERNYYDYGFNRLLLKWNESEMTHNNCDYGFYCDQDQLKITLLKKIEILNSSNKYTLDEVTFKTENNIISENTLLKTDGLFKDSVIDSLSITDLRRVSLSEYTTAIDVLIAKLPTDLREIIILKSTVTPDTDLNAETITNFITIFTDNNFTKINDDYYFSVKSHLRAQPTIQNFFNAADQNTQLRFIAFNTKILRNLNIYYGDALNPVVVNTKTFNSTNIGITNEIFTGTGDFLTTQKALPFSESSEVTNINSPRTVKIFIETPTEPKVSIKESDLSSILNYYEQSKYLKYKSNMLFTNPINAYYFNYTGKLFKESETGISKETEIITNHDIWSKGQDGYLLSISTRGNGIHGIIYKNIRPIQIISKTNNSYLLQYTNAGNEAKSLDRNMFWYDNIDAKLLEIKPITGNNRYLLQNGKSYKTTIFAFVNCPTQKIELFTKRPIQTNYKFTFAVPSALISEIPEKEYFVIPGNIVNEKFRPDELQNINSVFNNITSQNVCFNFYDANRISLWYNPEKVNEESQ